MTRWPNLFIAGAPRSGTSSLHSYLQGIPGIYMSRIKEPNFFSRNTIADDHPMVKPIRDETQYLRLFEDAGDARILGEASPTYLRGSRSARADRPHGAAGRRSLRACGIRSSGLHSHYLMMLNNRPGMGSFMDEVRKGLAQQYDRSLPVLGPDVGLYYQQVQRYREVFGDARFKVLIFEETMSDVPAALRGVLEFLGIEHDLANFDAPAQRQYSEARGPIVRYLFGNRFISRSAEALVPYRLRKLVRNTILVKQAAKPEMDAEARSFLVDYYAEDVRRLADYLGRALPWRNFFAAAG